MGLVMFSDTAYELLPPNSPRSALLQFERFFDSADRHPTASRSSGRRPGMSSAAARGSRAGCVMGLDALRRAHVTHGSLLLISDLNDARRTPDSLVAAALQAQEGAHPGPDRAGGRSARQTCGSSRPCSAQSSFISAVGVQDARANAAGPADRGVVALGADRGRRRPRRRYSRRTSSSTRGFVPEAAT